MGKPTIYICARVKLDAHAMNDRIIELLEPYFDIFAPHKKEAELKQTKDPMEIYKFDIDGMEGAAICVTIAPYGKDCAWEMGYFIGQGKPVFMYVPNLKAMPLDEWMISGGITVIVTDDVAVFKACQQEFKWSVLYSPPEGIGTTLFNYYNNGGR